MRKPLLAILVIGGVVSGTPAHAANSKDTVAPQSFEGTWQGVWHGYGAADDTEGSQSSLTLTLTMKAAANGELSGRTDTRGFQHELTPTQNPRPRLGAPPPHIPPPPPPLPTAPPSGSILNPRIQGRTLVFQVMGPDDRLVDFRLTLHGPNAGSLSVTRSSHPRVYPEFQMRRSHSYRGASAGY